MNLQSFVEKFFANVEGAYQIFYSGLEIEAIFLDGTQLPIKDEYKRFCRVIDKKYKLVKDIKMVTDDVFTHEFALENLSMVKFKDIDGVLSETSKQMYSD